MSSEHHAPYFVSLKRLLRLEKIVDFSFIAQCFVMKKMWIKEFIAELQAVHGESWIKAILQNADLSHPAGFSEYETLGNWLMARHKSDIAFNPARWERLGSSRCGLKGLDQFKTEFPDVTFMAFESWDGVIGTDSVVQMSALGMGGSFGDQIFQYFFLCLIRERFECEVFCPQWLGNQVFTLGIGCQLTSSAFQVNFRVEAKRSDTPRLDFERVQFLMLSNNTKSLDISGDFQYHTKFLRPYKELFLSTFRVNKALTDAIDEWLNSENIKKIIAVHICTPTNNDNEYHGYVAKPSAEDMRRQISELMINLNESVVIYLASDRLDLFSNELESLGVEFLTIDDLPINFDGLNKSAVDFLMITIADCVFISNSTFPFSASMLNQKAKSFFRPCLRTGKYLSFDPWNDNVLHTKSVGLYL